MNSIRIDLSSLMTKWPQELPLTARSPYPTAARVRILLGTCENVVSDSVGFHLIFPVSSTIYDGIVTNYVLNGKK